MTTAEMQKINAVRDEAIKTSLENIGTLGSDNPEALALFTEAFKAGYGRALMDVIDGKQSLVLKEATRQEYMRMLRVVD